MMPSFIVFHPLQLPAKRDLSRPHISKSITWNNILQQGEYTNTQQDLPVGDSYITNSRHERLFGHLGFFC
jgi:hypothetical protein